MPGPPCTSSGSALDSPPAPDVVNRQDRIVVARLPAPVDDFLRASLDLGVAALHRVEIEVGGVLAGRHRRCRAAAQTDPHAGATELDQQRIVGQRALVRIASGDVADAAGNHDRLVIAAHLARDLLLERAEVAEQVRPSEFVVERCAADRAVEHDVQRRCDAVRLAVVDFPRLRQPGNTQVRHGKSGQARLRLRAYAGRALVADFAAGARRSARKRRDRRRMIVRLDLHQHVSHLGARSVMAVRTGIEAPRGRARHHRGVVFVRDDRAFGIGFVRSPDHCEQRQWRSLAVDRPVGVEYLVPAVLGVGLREHHQLDVGRIASRVPEARRQVVDFVVGQRQTQAGIRFDDRLASAADQLDRFQRQRRNFGEQTRSVA